MSLAFDRFARALAAPLVAPLLASLMACGGAPPPKPAANRAPASPISERMDAFTINGYVLAGAEYWPYLGKEELRYPDEVLWGFYPEQGVVPPGETDPNPDSARPEAIDCAHAAFAALQVFLAKNPASLRKIVDLGAEHGYVPRFYLWTNDYSRAAEPYPHGVREARLWYWKRKRPEPPKPPGYWKWEATLTQRGECLVPRPEQVESYLAETLAALENRKRAAR